MIAEELFKLMQKNERREEQYLTTREAADLLRKSVSHITHNLARYPHIKNGRQNLFPKSELQIILDSGVKGCRI